jgi:hypothetical protein
LAEAEARLKEAEAAVTSGVGGRGLHLSTSQLNVSKLLWVTLGTTADRRVIARHKLDTKQLTDKSGLG